MQARRDPVVVMRGIRKAFGPIEVLRGVDLEILPGEVHVLAGENGAGKSTLVKILSGVYADFAGELQVGDRRRRFASPTDAARAGIATIHQELSLVPAMSVSDNLFLGRERILRFGWMNFESQTVEAERILRDAGLDCTPGQPAGTLSLSSQQMLEIARALARDARVVVLDEPTSALSAREVDSRVARVRALRDEGRGIVFITHRMEEIYRLADRITVLRDGSLVGTATPDALPPDRLVEWMIGRQVTRSSGPDRAAPATPALEVDHLRVRHGSVEGRLVVDDVSLSVGRGEIVGLAGLQGAGTSEVLHAVFGALGRRVTGRARLDGEPFPMRDPGDSIARGVVLLTNDRKALGLAPDASVLHSISLASLTRFSTGAGWVRRRAERAAVENLARGFDLRTPSLDAPVRTLSGGNQQKAYLARCLLAQPRVLLLDEPTRGVDVGAKADVYGLMRAWVGRGIGILLITSEMEELLALCDRILVMHRGRIAAELPRESASKDAVLAAAMGHAVAAEAGGRT
jgi:ribose transport system ATP-binding protein